MAKVCCKSFDEEYKCGGCNYKFTTAWYLDCELEPERDQEDEDRLTSGVCANCFCEMMQGKELLP